VVAAAKAQGEDAMKTALLAAAAATAAALTFSSGAAFADTVNTSTWRPHGSQAGRIYRATPRVVVRHEHVYRPVRRPVYHRPVDRPTPIQISAANLAALKREIYADGRVTFIEKIKLKAAERRHAALVRSYYR
jgi:hypothetical protein